MPAKLSAPPTTSAEVRSLMASEVVKSAPDKDRLRFLGELLVSFEKVEAQGETAASKLLPATIAERDTLLARVTELEPLVARVAELETFKATNDEWRAEQVRALTEEATKTLWVSERARNEAEEKLREADNKVSASGWTELRKTLAELIARHGIPQPDFWATSATMPAAFWQLWGWSDTKARVFTAYKMSYPTVSESFKAHAYRILAEGLPIFPMLIQQTENGPQPIYPEREQKGIADLGVRTECIREMCQRFNCLEEIQKRVDERQAAELGQHLRSTANSLQVQEQDLSRRGYGRSPVAVQPESSTGFTGECIDPANCCCPKHHGLPARFRNSLDGVEESF
jgi:hypothetical protein